MSERINLNFVSLSKELILMVNVTYRLREGQLISKPSSFYEVFLYTVQIYERTIQWSTPWAIYQYDIDARLIYDFIYI